MVEVLEETVGCIGCPKRLVGAAAAIGVLKEDCAGEPKIFDCCVVGVGACPNKLAEDIACCAGWPNNPPVVACTGLEN